MHLADAMRLWQLHVPQTGVGVFETILMHERRIPLLLEHWERAVKGMQALLLPWPSALNSAMLLYEAQVLAERHDYTNARLKLQLSATADGIPVYLLTMMLWTDAPWLGGEREVCLYPTPLLCFTPYSFAKSLSRQPYELALRYAQQHGCNECLLMNEQRQIVEGANSNVFIYEGSGWLTPALPSGAVTGVLRRVLLEQFEAEEGDISPERLLASDEVILTNAVRGVQPIAVLNNNRLFETTRGSELAQQVQQWLLEKKN